MAFEENCANQALKTAQIMAFEMVGEEGFEPSSQAFIAFHPGS